MLVGGGGPGIAVAPGTLNGLAGVTAVGAAVGIDVGACGATGVVNGLGIAGAGKRVGSPVAPGAGAGTAISPAAAAAATAGSSI